MTTRNIGLPLKITKNLNFQKMALLPQLDIQHVQQEISQRH
jgi:hypothetical protein